MKNLFKRKKLLTILMLVSFFHLSSQVFWSEDFGSFNQIAYKPILAASYMSNGPWTVTELATNGSDPNKWFISSVEAGMGAGNCSSSYNSDSTLLNNTLYISRIPIKTLSANSTNFIDFGARYYKGVNSSSDYRIETPKIDCSNKTDITLSFDYFCGGNAISDYFSLYYFNGVTWDSLTTLMPTNSGSCSRNSTLWKKSITYNLPSTANNNPTVKIGFRWKNSVVEVNTFPVDTSSNDSGASIASTSINSNVSVNVASSTQTVATNATTSNNGSGIPISTGIQGLDANEATLSFKAAQISVAIDNITLSGSAYVDPNNNIPRTVDNNNNLDIKTQTIVDKKNNPNIVFTTYNEKYPANDLIIESSTDGNNFNELTQIRSKAVKGVVGKLEYNFTDSQANDGVNYYRIKQVNSDKTTVVSKIVSVDHIKAKNITFTVYPNPNSGQFTVDFSGIENNHEVQIVLNDMNDGHEIYSTTFYSNSIDSNKIDVNPPTKIAPGRYICSLIFEGIRSSVIVMIN